MKKKIWYHFDKLKDDYCHCLFYGISIIDNVKYIKFYCQFEENDIDFDSLESYEQFCTFSKWKPAKGIREIKLHDFLEYDIKYNILKKLHDNIYNKHTGEYTIRFENLSPEEAFKRADEKLNRGGHGTIYKPLYKITEDIEEGYYWSDYIIEDLKGIFNKELKEYERKEEEWRKEYSNDDEEE